MEAKRLQHAVDDRGMEIYDYIVNNVPAIEPELPDLIERLNECDISGQFLASTARFLSGVEPERFRDHVSRLIEFTISKDRERKYIGSLLAAIWGEDYLERAEELRDADDNFRRIYRRVYGSNGI